MSSNLLPGEVGVAMGGAAIAEEPFRQGCHEVGVPASWVSLLGAWLVPKVTEHK